MRQPEVCKHQVCDHCGGRFGMVTHRWWGNKFCKRRCKNAYLRENHHTLSGWIIPRFFTFAGGAFWATLPAGIQHFPHARLVPSASPRARAGRDLP
jgi:hypothetical protein